LRKYSEHKDRLIKAFGTDADNAETIWERLQILDLGVAFLDYLKAFYVAESMELM
jgi:hypothetical protein